MTTQSQNPQTNLRLSPQYTEALNIVSKITNLNKTDIIQNGLELFFQSLDLNLDDRESIEALLRKWSADQTDKLFGQSELFESETK